MSIIKNNKAQITIVGILMVFITLVIFLAIMPAMNDVIDNATIGANATITGESEVIIVRLIPLMMLISIVVSIFVYVQPSSG